MIASGRLLKAQESSPSFSALPDLSALWSCICGFTLKHGIRDAAVGIAGAAVWFFFVLIIHLAPSDAI
jgi:hypothetical protein